MKCLDLFSGIATWSLAFHKFGIDTVAFCEIDKNARLVISKNFPGVPIFEDIKDVDGKEFKGIDIITSSFPCVDISVGGRQKGLIDKNGDVTRSGLWFETLRIINEARPRYAIIENVERLRKNGLGTVLSGLARAGYDAQWFTVGARDVGLPHQRQRLFIISYPCEQRHDEYIGKGGYVQAYKEWKSEEIYSERKECEFKLRKVRSILSNRAFEDFRNSNPDIGATLSELRRVTNGVPIGLDEYRRKQRIKQLGNAIVPQIAEVIARKLIYMEHES